MYNIASYLKISSSITSCFVVVAQNAATLPSNKSSTQQAQSHTEEVISNGVSSTNSTYNNKKSSKLSTTTSTDNIDSKENCKTKHSNHIEDYQIIEQSLPAKRHNNLNDYEEENLKNDEQAKSYKQSNGVTSKNATKLNTQKDLSSTTSGNTSNKKGKNTNAGKEASGTHYTNNKEDLISR